MQYIIATILCLTCSVTCFAGTCQDMQDVVGRAVQERNGRVTDIYNVMMADPESERGMLSDCLSTVNNLGDAFSLGVSLPDMTQIIEGMCSQVDSLIQQKINDTHNQVLDTVNSIGGNNVFKVYGTGGDYVVKIKDRLQ
ncbi:MAG: hypothetical protein IJD16_07835 [Desulfovibrio sp.]|nr:hypothetical protein [Desulfovibrio sp.]